MEPLIVFKKVNKSEGSLIKKKGRSGSDDIEDVEDEESYYDSKNGEEEEQTKLYKEGFIWKKQDKQFISAWDRRYIVLDRDKITFYEDAQKKQAGKQIDLKRVNFVGFHYDPGAPVKSKRLSNKEKDESRFDIYTADRVYMMHSDEKSVHDSLEWI